MAEIVLSAFLTVLFEKLASSTLISVARYKGVDVEIKKWQRWLKQIQRVLADASRKEITDEAVKDWLNNLHHLAYDIDDVLDDLATEAMHREFTHDSEATTSKVRKLLPSCCTNFSRSTRMHGKLDVITTKLEDLIQEKANLGLRVDNQEPMSKNKNRRLQTSMVHASSIVGRQAEKEALVHKLLADEPCDQKFSVVPIVGMGGVGKTTLARLLYDDEQVKDHFQLKAWVCVSDDFDSFAISKVIFQSVTGETKDFEDLNLLQVDLKNHLRDKRFLLVLDDVWSESYEDWETLVGPFHACAPGSKIIMTTRKDKLLRKLGYNHLNQQLQRLSDEDALPLVAIHALGVNNFDSHLSLKTHGERIVKKCDGLPLALVALGRLLRTKNDDEEYWEEVLNSEIWGLQDVGGIIPALRLSYHDLSAHLKQLFAYCSLFPKDFMFDKEELVLLWIAEGFLQQSTSSGTTEERLGYEYFDELLSRSFFQHAPNSKSLFVMHDLMNDLATFVASEFFTRLDNEKGKGIQEKSFENYRHMSFVREQYVTYEKFELFKRAKSLRTFLATSVEVLETWDYFYLSNKTLADLLPKVPLLRVLCLSYFKISEVPESIGTLRHLRYLNLSRTDIRCLPETVCNLYNLETLIVSVCRNLSKLPNNFLTLKKLRHLDIRDTPHLDEMPLGIGKLKSLQTLSKIIIGGKGGFEISKLRDLENLCGKISIMGLEKVQNAMNAREANFSQKKISELEVVWSDVSDDSREEILEEGVLNELKPQNKYLKRFKIGSYGGIKFPNWVGDPSFVHLKHVSILGCKKCTSLPPLGQIPSLEELFIEGLDGVKVVSLEFLGTSLAFTSLKILSFVDMSQWEKWSTNIGVVFPCLQELVITNCPNLSEVLLEALPSLNVLKIDRCDNGVLRGLVHVASSINKLEIESISGLNDVVWKGVIQYLGAVEELDIRRCNEIRYLWEQEASKVLVNLREMEVWDCDNLERCSCPDTIETLSVWSCTSVTIISFPTGGEKLKFLQIVGCNTLLETEWGRQKINRTNMPMLEDVAIKHWPNLKSIVELNYLVHLTTLKILDCENLESFPDSELPNLTSLKVLEIRNCPSMHASFPRGFWPPRLRFLGIGKLKNPISDWGPQNFPTSLEGLRLYGGSSTKDDVRSFSHLSHLLPSSLISLRIEEFEKLESLSIGLQHLTSLRHLTFFQCPNMMHLPLMLLPSLLCLVMGDCPNLKERCSTGGYYWHQVSHIPHVLIGSISHL